MHLRQFRLVLQLQAAKSSAWIKTPKICKKKTCDVHLSGVCSGVKAWLLRSMTALILPMTSGCWNLTCPSAAGPDCL